MVVIDPRRTATARGTQAEWIAPRPGTDAALALGMMALIIAEDRYDHEFVDRWSHGFGELRAYCADFDPATVERITGVSAERMVALAREIAATSRCALVGYSGLEYSECGVHTMRALWSLQALCGHLDAPGGNVFRMSDGFRVRRTMTAPPPGVAAIGGEHPAFIGARHEAHAVALPRAILEGDPYPVRALIIGGSSLLTSWPDPALWRRAFAALDLLVVIDLFPTADGEYADYLLPAAGGYEIESYVVRHTGRATRVTARRPVIDPPGEARSDYRIYAELAARLGYPERWPLGDRTMLERALAGSGVSAETLLATPGGIEFPDPPPRYRKYRDGELRADGQPGFETPSGCFEFVSEWLRELGHQALPIYVEPSAGPIANPDHARRYPLALTTGARTRTSFRSQHHNIPGLLRRSPAPRVQMHPDDAAARGISDGDRVWLRTAEGGLPFTAEVTPDIARGVVEAEMGGGSGSARGAWREANVNALLDPGRLDPISGFPAYHAAHCEVERAVE